MTTKELAIQAISRLPDSIDWMQIEERIHFVAGLRKGLYELDCGQGISHDMGKEEFAEWLSKSSGRHPPGERRKFFYSQNGPGDGV